MLTYGDIRPGDMICSGSANVTNNEFVTFLVVSCEILPTPIKIIVVTYVMTTEESSFVSNVEGFIDEALVLDTGDLKIIDIVTGIW